MIAVFIMKAGHAALLLLFFLPLLFLLFLLFLFLLLLFDLKIVFVFFLLTLSLSRMKLTKQKLREIIILLFPTFDWIQIIIRFFDLI